MNAISIKVKPVITSMGHAHMATIHSSYDPDTHDITSINGKRIVHISEHSRYLDQKSGVYTVEYIVNFA